MTATTSRPPLARKVTRKTEEARTAALDTGIVLKVDGQDFVVRVGDITPGMAREVRRVTGASVMQLIDTVSATPDLDVVSELIWVARRMRGETVTLEEVDAEFGGYDTLLSDRFDIAEAGPEVDDGPEA